MRVQTPVGPSFIFTILKRINYKCLKAESFVVNSVSNGVENAWKRKSHDFHNVNRSRLTLSTNRCSPLKCFAVIVAKMLWLYFPNLVVLSWFDCTFWLITNLTVLSRFYLRFWINSYSADPFQSYPSLKCLIGSLVSATCCMGHTSPCKLYMVCKYLNNYYGKKKVYGGRNRSSNFCHFEPISIRQNLDWSLKF